MCVSLHEPLLRGFEERLFARFEKDSSILGLWPGRKARKRRNEFLEPRSSVISRETLATLNAAGTLDSTSFRGVETRPKLLTIRSRMRAPCLSFLLETSNFYPEESNRSFPRLRNRTSFVLWQGYDIRIVPRRSGVLLRYLYL